MASSENNSDDGGFSSSNGSAPEYEHLMQFEYLKTKYRDVVSQLKTVSNEKQRLEHDFQLLKKELEGKGDFFNSTYHEYSGLKQKYDTLRHRYEEMTKDPSHYIKVCEELKKERNKYKELLKATELELETVLSERGSVLKENQKLYDKNEALEREVQGKAKECGALKEKIELLKTRQEYQQLSNESSWSKELSDSKDKFSIVSENLESANQEIERLKKALDKAKAEIAKAFHDTEVAKQRRDWAISEREKIVQERDSVRNLCDEIRKERDTATSKLLAAIRDKDDAHKKIELLTDQLEQVTRDSINNNATAGGQNASNLPGGGGPQSQPNGPGTGTPTTPNASLVSMNNSNSHRNSHYSSFSSIYNLESLQQYDVEMVEIDTSPLLSNSSDWGLTISGDLDHSYGSDHSNTKNLCGPYVAAVEHDSIFAGKLKPNDIICQINNHDCSTFSRRMIYRTIRNSVPQCIITVKRPTKRLLPVQIPFTSTNRNHGLCLELGLYIAKLEPNSIAAKDGRLAVGDRILSINNKPMESIKNINDVHAYINDMRNSSLNLIVIKEMPESHPSYASFYQPRLKHIRNTTSCTQTDNSLSTFGSQHTTNTSSVNTSANAMTMMNHRLSLEFDNNNHFLPSVMPSSAYQPSSSTPNSVAASTPSSTKSASKLTEFIQKIKDKMAISNHSKEAGGPGGSQEHDAIAALDSVLDSDEQSRDGKRSKRRSKNDPHHQSEVPRGTWPRVNMAMHINETHPGTIVQKKKIRPQLTIPRGGGDLDNNNYFAAVLNEAHTIPTTFQPNTVPGGSLSPGGIPSGGGGGGGGVANASGPGGNGGIVGSGPSSGQGTLPSSSKRNSNPVMPIDLNRLLAAKYGEATAGMAGGPITGGMPTGVPTMGKSNTIVPFPRSSTYDDRHHDGGGLNLNKHRFSLNFPPTSKQQMQQQQQQQQQLMLAPHQQQNSLDFIPIPTSSSQKSNHSIDSASAPHSLSKSPPTYYSGTAAASLGIPTSKTTEFFMTSKITKSLSKYSSDNESIDTETLSLGGGMGGMHGTGTPMSGMSTNMGATGGGGGNQGITGAMVGPGNTNTLPLTHMRKHLMGNSGSGGGGGSSSNRSGSTVHPAATAGYGATIFPGSYPHPFMRNHHQPGGGQNGGGGASASIANDALLSYPAAASGGGSGGSTGPAAMGHHSHGASMDYSAYRYSQIQSSKEDVPISGYTGGYEGGTFPRNKSHLTSNSNHHHHHHHHHHQGGFRIPSNQSVTSRGSGIKISNGSIDCSSSERASPIPTFEVQVLKPGHAPPGGGGPGSNKRSSLQDYGHSKPNVGELRLVQIDKSEMSLGIKIFCRRNGGGVFVSNVGENSLASKVGLHIGDQLLEVCGINLRKATYELAAHVLRQCGNSITMLVLYNPVVYSNLTTSEDNLARSGSPTPQNSPRSMGRSLISAVNTTAVNAMTGTMTAPKTSSLVKAQEFSDSLEHQTQLHDDEEDGSVAVGSSGVGGGQSNMYKEQPREIYIETRKTSNLGITLVGGNAYGIFVHGVQKDSIADQAGLLVGDQILEFNGTDMRRSTAEHAALEIAKPADHVKVLVLYNIQKFNQIKDKPGDALYIRVGFDRNCDQGDSELSFTKDEVLFVDNTMFGGIPGKWRAWKLDEYGHKRQCGIIPNKLKVEEELRLLGDPGDVDTTARRGSTSARRSFFKRIKPQRSSSRDSKELASFSNTHLSLYLDSGSLSDDGLSSYQRVERLEYTYRPVIILGPLYEFVIDKLCVDFPEDFAVLQESQKKCTKDEMELAIQNNTIADYKMRSNGIFEYTSMQAVRDNKQCHCILNVGMAAVERLQRAQIYPIVLLLRFKSAKQIKEIKDSRYSTDKISAKAAKEMYEHTLKLESEYRQFISGVISGVNITHMCTQIKAAVDCEQKKILWVSIPSPL
uniref:Discs large MAGUK scaffold protein 5 n=1 Tax=Anopheles melas TaxID=34690 RepID=A0A182U1X5_9DIPT